jgi:single-strand DNA-binding protein
MNKVILMGRLTRDPDIRYSAHGDRQMAIARYTLAVDRRFRRSGSDGNEQSADFISCVVFDRGAEFAEKYLHQGTKIVVTGRIQTGSYTNKDGVRVYTTDVVVEDQEFAESKAVASGYNNSNSYGAGNANYNSNNNGYAQQDMGRPNPASAVGDGFMNIPDGVDDEGLPFN